jgi:hypothetical protein
MPPGCLFEFAVKGSNASRGKEKEKAWRVAEFEGINERSLTATSDDWAKVDNDPPVEELVVLGDANLGFRDNQSLWSISLTAEGSHPWVLVKTSPSVAEGALWEHPFANHIGEVMPSTATS